MIEPGRLADEHAVPGRPERRVPFPAREVGAAEEGGERRGLEDRRLLVQQTEPAEDDRGEVAPAQAAGVARLHRIAAVVVPAAADEADQAFGVGLLLEHVHRAHDAVRAAQVGRAVVLGPGLPRGAGPP